MRNRDLAYSMLERIDNMRVNLKRMVKTGQPLKDYLDELDRMETLIEELKSMIELEPVGK